MKENDLLLFQQQSQLDASQRPSLQVERALSHVQDTFQMSPLVKLPFPEMAALGGSFAPVVKALAAPAEDGLYRCVFPEGITGTLAKAKDGSGYLGTILDGGIVGQARWVPVETSLAPVCLEATLVAVAALAIVKQFQDLKKGQQKLLDFLELDKRSQLQSDYDCLAEYLHSYQSQWTDEGNRIAALSDVKSIHRNAMKDILFYETQLNELLHNRKELFKLSSPAQQIGRLLTRFIHYKLALHVHGLSAYLEVILSKNFHPDQLHRVERGLRQYDVEFQTLYTACLNRIEALQRKALSVQAKSKLAQVSRSTGRLLEKLPLVNKSSADDFFLGVGELLSEREQAQLEKTLSTVRLYRDSGLTPIAQQLSTLDQLYNRPVVMLCDKDGLTFYPLQGERAV